MIQTSCTRQVGNWGTLHEDSGLIMDLDTGVVIPLSKATGSTLTRLTITKEKEIISTLKIINTTPSIKTLKADEIDLMAHTRELTVSLVVNNVKRATRSSGQKAQISLAFLEIYNP